MSSSRRSLFITSAAGAASLLVIAWRRVGQHGDIPPIGGRTIPGNVPHVGVRDAPFDPALPRDSELDPGAIVRNVLSPQPPQEAGESAATSGITQLREAAQPMGRIRLTEAEREHIQDVLDRSTAVFCEVLADMDDAEELPSADAVTAQVATALEFAGMETPRTYSLQLRQVWVEIRTAHRNHGLNQAFLVGLRAVWCLGLPPVM